MIKCTGTHFDPAIVQAFTTIPIDTWREARHLANEPGLVMKDSQTGRDIRYSALTMGGNPKKETQNSFEF